MKSRKNDLLQKMDEKIYAPSLASFVSVTYLRTLELFLGGICSSLSDIFPIEFQCLLPSGWHYLGET